MGEGSSWLFDLGVWIDLPMIQAFIGPFEKPLLAILLPWHSTLEDYVITPQMGGNLHNPHWPIGHCHMV